MTMHEVALQKIKSYCAYQERSHQQVRYKLIELEVYGDDLEEMISVLIAENFLNEERYARSIARGKFKIKQWGRQKINYALKQEKVSAYCIRQAMTEIDEDEYLKTLDSLADKKLSTLKSEKNKFIKMTKLRNYLMQKGYESEYIRDILQQKLN
ncbi:MAG TPA: regulatory protein RecX [Chitinophagaceae bacterium]|nr:regulatory protein RecX [Chitinophagaceae bacterium]